MRLTKDEISRSWAYPCPCGRQPSMFVGDLIVVYACHCTRGICREGFVGIGGTYAEAIGSWNRKHTTASS